MTDPLMLAPINLGRWFGTQVRVHIFLILFVVVTAVSVYTWYVEKAQGFGTAQTRRRATSAVSAAASA